MATPDVVCAAFTDMTQATIVLWTQGAATTISAAQVVGSQDEILSKSLTDCGVVCDVKGGSATEKICLASQLNDATGCSVDRQCQVLVSLSAQLTNLVRILLYTVVSMSSRH